MTMDVENICQVQAESLLPADAITGTGFPGNTGVCTNHRWIAAASSSGIHKAIGGPFQ